MREEVAFEEESGLLLNRATDLCDMLRLTGLELTGWEDSAETIESADFSLRVEDVRSDLSGERRPVCIRLPAAAQSFSQP